MRPGADSADHRGPARYLWWLVRCQKRRIAAGATLASLWMIGLTVPPYALSRAIDDGLTAGHRSSLVLWSAALLVVGLANAWLGIMRHRTMSRIRMDANFRTVRVVVRQVTRLGAGLSGRMAAGEVVTIGGSDVLTVSQALTTTGPGVGAVLAYAVVGALLFSISGALAAVVLLGVPVLALLVGPLLARLGRVQTAYRRQQSGLAAHLVDVLDGLSVLNAFGGKQTYAKRYRAESERLCQQGYRVGAVTSWIDALGVGLPAVFLATVTWLAARMATEGAITVGELVAVYGYVAVLLVPVSLFIEGGYDVTSGLVAARRITRFLALEPPPWIGTHAGPDVPAVLRDPESGVRVEPGRMTVIASARPAEGAAVLERLCGFVESDATWGAERLDSVGLREIRDRIVLADNDGELFAGSVRNVVAGRFQPDDETITRAMHAAAAQDVVLGLRHGLDSRITASGRNLSGGQRQRIRLARALLADPEVLMAVDPTSALDAQTEAVVAARVHTARAGRTTVFSSTSPLLLAKADTVVLLVDGAMAAAGEHQALLRNSRDYRRLLSWEDDDLSSPVSRPVLGAGPATRSCPEVR